MSTVSGIKGFADLFPPESSRFTALEEAAHRVFRRYGYAELRTPVLEHTELFRRSIGAETDVVQKEMYSFPDRKQRSLTLRPEATAGVVRAYIASGLHSRESVSKLFSYGPMFRYERPQKGRMRQFHQLNCECLGAHAPQTDAEVISMLMALLREIGIADAALQLNSLGCSACRPAYRTALTAYLRSLDALAFCEDCRRRLETNPLRVLDCKIAGCRAHTEGAPRIMEHACPPCRAHFDCVLELLAALRVPFTLDHRLVRGLDYYMRTTFEAVSGSIGAQSSLAGGGRYDGLIKLLGGPDLPGIGFACGMERLALLMPAQEAQRPDFFVVCVAQEAHNAAFLLAAGLRAQGFVGDMAHTGGSFKSQMRQADKSGARFCCVLGPDELAAGAVMLKNMDTGEQRSLPQADAIARIAAAGKRCP
ncbi:MAG: histidine--tRNA ligase [Deltaproteobacteria bacterium]|jgi:histidyl-tRNA synthetase|nr:histidine--tRNA ligase [Deltaproteobacteria bacterium]